MGNCLLVVRDEIMGRVDRYDYDEFDNLISAEYERGGEVERLYRVPDRMGNLVFKELKEMVLRGGIVAPIDKERLETELGICFHAFVCSKAICFSVMNNVILLENRLVKQ